VGKDGFRKVTGGSRPSYHTSGANVSRFEPLPLSAFCSPTSFAALSFGNESESHESVSDPDLPPFVFDCSASRWGKRTTSSTSLAGDGGVSFSRSSINSQVASRAPLVAPGGAPPRAQGGHPACAHGSTRCANTQLCAARRWARCKGCFQDRHGGDYPSISLMVEKDKGSIMQVDEPEFLELDLT
jgi:hypothetical protein